MGDLETNPGTLSEGWEYTQFETISVMYDDKYDHLLPKEYISQCMGLSVCLSSLSLLVHRVSDILCTLIWP